MLLVLLLACAPKELPMGGPCAYERIEGPCALMGVTSEPLADGRVLATARYDLPPGAPGLRWRVDYALPADRVDALREALTDHAACGGERIVRGTCAPGSFRLDALPFEGAMVRSEPE